MQKHIAHCKSLVQDQNFLVANHMIQLLAKVQVALSTCQILQETWDNAFATILKVHQDFFISLWCYLIGIVYNPLALLSKRGRDICIL